MAKFFVVLLDEMWQNRPNITLLKGVSMFQGTNSKSVSSSRAELREDGIAVTPGTGPDPTATCEWKRILGLSAVNNAHESSTGDTAMNGASIAQPQLQRHSRLSVHSDDDLGILYLLLYLFIYFLEAKKRKKLGY